MSAPAMRERPSPSHGPRAAGTAIDTLVLHYTGMETADAALDRLCDAAAEVSAHYLIDEDGAVWRLVGEDRRAWHAGLAAWRGATDINDRSIGIELVNPGHEFGYRPFPKLQMSALIELCRDILARHAIPVSRVLGHSDIAPTRKTDPGELFDWRRMARAGIGLWPEPGALPAKIDNAQRDEALRRLGAIGYDTSGQVAPDSADAQRAAIAAFQRRYRPRLIDGVIDSETGALIAAVATP
ncbi:MAG: N-acetylmuramoyl-L-alanine amidase [Alphaproteobacteria bacterium]